MSSLAISDIVGGGRSDAVPEVILCKPRHIEIGDAEKDCFRQYKESAAELAKSLADMPDLARSVTQGALADIREGRLRWNTNAFGAYATDRANLPFLTYLCARVRHPQITVAEATRWFCDYNADKLARVVWELWGYVPGEGRRWREKVAPPDWEAIYAMATRPATADPPGLGLTSEQFAEMTPDQLHAMASAGIKTDVNELRRRTIFDHFERVCDALGVEPQHLAAVDDATLVTWMREAQLPADRGKAISAAVIRPFVAQYVAACQGD